MFKGGLMEGVDVKFVWGVVGAVSGIPFDRDESAQQILVME